MRVDIPCIDVGLKTRIADSCVKWDVRGYVKRDGIVTYAFMQGTRQYPPGSRVCMHVMRSEPTLTNLSHWLPLAVLSGESVFRVLNFIVLHKVRPDYSKVKAISPSRLRKQFTIHNSSPRPRENTSGISDGQAQASDDETMSYCPSLLSF